MAKKFGTNLDLGRNEIQNAVIQVLSSNPSQDRQGQVYFSSVADRLMVRSSAGWYDSTARSSHTGTQVAATISDLATTVQAYKLNQFAAPTASVAMGSQRITGLADAVLDTDAANLGQVKLAVQNGVQGLSGKASVRLVATSNVTLSGLNPIDGVTPVVGNRVLLTAQTNAAENGVYVVASGAWTRATDADATGEINPGAFWYVEEGVVEKKSQWWCNNTGTITIGVTAIVINRYGTSANMTASDGLSVSGNVWTVKASTGITVTAAGVAVDSTVVARKAQATIGDGATLNYVVTHNLGTQDVMVTLRELATNNHIEADIQSTSINTVTISFAAGNAPAQDSVRVSIIG